MMKPFYHCGLYQYQLTIVGTHNTTENGMVSLDCNMAGLLQAVTSRIGKDLLTDRKDPWAESKDLQGLLLKKSISKDLKEPQRTLETLPVKVLYPTI